MKAYFLSSLLVAGVLCVAMAEPGVCDVAKKPDVSQSGKVVKPGMDGQVVGSGDAVAGEGKSGTVGSWGSNLCKVLCFMNPAYFACLKQCGN